MELKDLQYFLAVAQAGGFRRAADYLGIQQSAVSRRIRTLEDHLGVSLFERSHAGTRVTQAGSRFLEGVKRPLDQLETAVRTVNAAGLAAEGTLRIGIVASISSGFANRLIHDWWRDHPSVELNIVDGAPTDHVSAVSEHRLDLTFVTGSPYSNGCDIEGIWEEPVYVAMPSGHVLSRRHSIALGEIANEAFIVSRAAPGPEIHDFIIKRLSDLGSSPQVRFMEVGRETLMAMIGLRIGVSLVSGAEVGVAYPGVVFVPICGERLPFSAIWSPSNGNPALRNFLSAARIQARRTKNRD